MTARSKGKGARGMTRLLIVAEALVLAAPPLTAACAKPSWWRMRA